MKSLSDNFPGQITAAERHALESLLAAAGFNPDGSEASAVAGDGSDRRFLRISSQGHSLIAVLPASVGNHGLAEARSAWAIGRHLRACGVPVPELHGFDNKNGILLCEDLGDRSLHRQFADQHRSEEMLFEFYEEALVVLAHMQIVGGRNFDPDWCWDTGRYDRQLMLARESGYFTEACCRKFLGIDQVPAALQEDFSRLAGLAAEQPGGFFLHRDFQSRNIMIKDGRIRVIDFQGGRLGPLGYDLASLLIDPYVSLPKPVRERLFHKYLEVLAGYPGIDAGRLADGYHLLALQRNLQILGAFAFLANEKGKSFFRAYLMPALLDLNKLLDGPAGHQFPVLKDFAAALPERLTSVLN